MAKNSFSAEVTFKPQPHKMVRHIQTIRWQFADEWSECV